MPNPHAWGTLRTQQLLQTPYYRVVCDRLLHPAGHELDYYVIHYRREAAGIVPVGEDGRVLMVQQWRHPAQRLAWSIPAGAIEDGEDPTKAAVREMREESGYIAREVAPLYRYYAAIGTSDAAFQLFVGRGIERVGEHDAKEICAVDWFTAAQIEAMIERNELVDGLSLTALLLWRARKK